MPATNTQSQLEIPATPTVQEVAAQLSEQAGLNIDAILNSQITMPPPATPTTTTSATTEASSSSPSPSATVPISIPARQTKQENSDEAMSVPPEVAASSFISTSPLGAASLESTSMLASSVSSSVSATSETKKKNRCVFDSCKRKVGLTGNFLSVPFSLNPAFPFRTTNIPPFFFDTVSLLIILFFLFAGFDCRCGGLFCWEHRYSDKHNCKFDYKELGQDQIRKNNPIVIGEKIQKI
jgi:hypothetical protein